MTTGKSSQPLSIPLVQLRDLMLHTTSRYSLKPKGIRTSFFTSPHQFEIRTRRIGIFWRFAELQGHPPKPQKQFICRSCLKRFCCSNTSYTCITVDRTMKVAAVQVENSAEEDANSVVSERLQTQIVLEELAANQVSRSGVAISLLRRHVLSCHPHDLSCRSYISSVHIALLGAQNGVSLPPYQYCPT